MTTIEIATSDLFGRVRANIEETKLIAWDGCHKIYMAMDEAQSEWFRDNYENVVEADPATMLTTLAAWWEDSCFLRFIQAVSTNEEDPNAGYTTMIDQGEDYEDEDEDEDENY